MTPLPFTWDGEALRPISSYWAKKADAEYVIGERYQIAPIEERSSASHSHFFAAVNEAFHNLPERLAEEFPTADHLRRYALIKTGFRNDAQISCASQAEAVRAAVVAKSLDPYCIAVPRNGLLTIYTAKSQSFKAMGKEEFQRSKEAVLAFLATLIEVEPVALSARAKENVHA